MITTLIIQLSVSLLLDILPASGVVEPAFLQEVLLSLHIVFVCFSFFLVNNFSVSFADSSFFPQTLEYPRVQSLGVFSFLATCSPLMIAFSFKTFHAICELTTPKCISLACNALLNSKLICQSAHSASPIGGLINISNIVQSWPLDLSYQSCSHLS